MEGKPSRVWLSAVVDLWLWPDKARADIRAASLRARSGYRLGPRAVARRADLGLRLTSSSRADLAVAGGAGQRPKKTQPG